MWRCTSTATGSSTGHTSDRCQPHHQDVPPTVSNIPPPRRVIAPLVAASARARWRASETSCKDDFGRERPRLARGEGVAPHVTRGGTPPHSPSRASGEKGGGSRLSPLRWRGWGPASLGRKTRTEIAKTGRRQWYTPHLVLWYTPPSDRVTFRAAPASAPASAPEHGRAGSDRVAGGHGHELGWMRP